MIKPYSIAAMNQITLLHLPPEVLILISANLTLVDLNYLAYSNSNLIWLMQDETLHKELYHQTYLNDEIMMCGSCGASNCCDDDFLLELLEGWTWKNLNIRMYNVIRQMISEMHTHVGMKYEHSYKPKPKSGLPYLSFFDIDVHDQPCNRLDDIIEWESMVEELLPEFLFTPDSDRSPVTLEDLNLRHEFLLGFGSIENNGSNAYTWSAQPDMLLLEEGVCLWNTSLNNYSCILPIEVMRNIFYRQASKINDKLQQGIERTYEFLSQPISQAFSIKQEVGNHPSNPNINNPITNTTQTNNHQITNQALTTISKNLVNYNLLETFKPQLIYVLNQVLRKYELQINLISQSHHNLIKLACQRQPVWQTDSNQEIAGCKLKIRYAARNQDIDSDDSESDEDDYSGPGGTAHMPEFLAYPDRPSLEIPHTIVIYIKAYDLEVRDGNFIYRYKLPFLFSTYQDPVVIINLTKVPNDPVMDNLYQESRVERLDSVFSTVYWNELPKQVYVSKMLDPNLDLSFLLPAGQNNSGHLDPRLDLTFLGGPS